MLPSPLRGGFLPLSCVYVRVRMRACVGRRKARKAAAEVWALLRWWQFIYESRVGCVVSAVATARSERFVVLRFGVETKPDGTLSLIFIGAASF